MHSSAMGGIQDNRMLSGCQLNLGKQMIARAVSNQLPCQHRVLMRQDGNRRVPGTCIGAAKLQLCCTSCRVKHPAAPTKKKKRSISMLKLRNARWIQSRSMQRRQCNGTALHQVTDVAGQGSSSTSLHNTTQHSMAQHRTAHAV